MQPDLRGQDHVRARLRTPILESARAHISRAVSLRDTVYETLRDSPPKKVAPEATSAAPYCAVTYDDTDPSQPPSLLVGRVAAMAASSSMAPMASIRSSGQTSRFKGARTVSKRLDGRTATKVKSAGHAAEHCPVSPAYGLDGGSIPGIAHTVSLKSREEE